MNIQRINIAYIITGLCLLANYDILTSQNVDTVYHSENNEQSTSIELNEFRDRQASHDLWLGLGYSTGLDRSKKVLGNQEYLLTFGGYISRSKWLQFNGSYLHTPLPETSNPVYSIDNGVSIIELSLEFKLYTPSAYEFLGQYFSGGIGLAFSYWNYSANSLGDDVSDSFDQVWGCDLHFGTGFVLGRLQPLNINLDITPGVILWISDSHQGYSNMILPMYYYLKVRVSLNCSVASW